MHMILILGSACLIVLCSTSFGVYHTCLSVPRYYYILLAAWAAVGAAVGGVELVGVAVGAPVGDIAEGGGGQA